MGPRLINRGNRRGGLRLRRFSFCFNGAAVDQPRKCRSLSDVGADEGASMGPRLINRGNDARDPTAGTVCAGFNGAAVDQPRK